MNLNIKCQTDDFGLTSSTNKFAKLLEVPTTLKGENNYNDIQIIFRLYHISSTSGFVTPKDYMLTVNYDGSNIVNFIDLNPKFNDVLKTGYVLENNKVTVYSKGSIIGASIKLQVLYCTIPGAFTFFNMSEFIYEPTLKYATNNIAIRKDITFLNGWQKHSYLPSFYVREGNIVTVTINTNNGNNATLTTLCEGLPRPFDVMTISCIDNEGVSGVLRLSADGSLKILKIINANKDVTSTFTYFAHF